MSGFTTQEAADDAEKDAGTAGPPRVPLGIERALGALAMAIICVISFANVIVRYVTDVSFAFTEEYSVFLLMFMTFVGASLAFARDGHIRIVFFTERFPRSLGRVAEGVYVAASLTMFGALVYYGAQLAWDQYSFGETSPGLGYPTWIYTIWMPILCLAVMGRIIGRAVRRARAR